LHSSSIFDSYSWHSQIKLYLQQRIIGIQFYLTACILTSFLQIYYLPCSRLQAYNFLSFVFIHNFLILVFINIIILSFVFILEVCLSTTALHENGKSDFPNSCSFEHDGSLLFVTALCTTIRAPKKVLVVKLFEPYAWTKKS